MRRKVKTYRATAAVLSPDLEVEQVGCVVYRADCDGVARARREFREQGIDLPRNARIGVELVCTDTYECTVDEFLSVAHRVE